MIGRASTGIPPPLAADLRRAAGPQPIRVERFLEAVGSAPAPVSVAEALRRLQARQLSFELVQAVVTHFGAVAVAPLIQNLRDLGPTPYGVAPLQSLLMSLGDSAVPALQEELNHLDSSTHHFLRVARVLGGIDSRLLSDREEELRSCLRSDSQTNVRLALAVVASLGEAASPLLPELMRLFGQQEPEFLRSALGGVLSEGFALDIVRAVDALQGSARGQLDSFLPSLGGAHQELLRAVLQAGSSTSAPSHAAARASNGGEAPGSNPVSPHNGRELNYAMPGAISPSMTSVGESPWPDFGERLRQVPTEYPESTEDFIRAVQGKPPSKIVEGALRSLERGTLSLPLAQFVVDSFAEASLPPILDRLGHCAGDYPYERNLGLLEGLGERASSAAERLEAYLNDRTTSPAKQLLLARTLAKLAPETLSESLAWVGGYLGNADSNIVIRALEVIAALGEQAVPLRSLVREILQRPTGNLKLISAAKAAAKALGEPPLETPEGDLGWETT